MTGVNMNNQARQGITSRWHALVEEKIGRRALLKSVAAAAAAMAATTSLHLQRANSALENAGAALQSPFDLCAHWTKCRSV
jgi:secreted PhoX family phosphatase